MNSFFSEWKTPSTIKMNSPNCLNINLNKRPRIFFKMYIIRAKPNWPKRTDCLCFVLVPQWGTPPPKVVRRAFTVLRATLSSSVSSRPSSARCLYDSTVEVLQPTHQTLNEEDLRVSPSFSSRIAWTSQGEEKNSLHETGAEAVGPCWPGESSPVVFSLSSRSDKLFFRIESRFFSKYSLHDSEHSTYLQSEGWPSCQKGAKTTSQVPGFKNGCYHYQLVGDRFTLKQFGQGVDGETLWFFYFGVLFSYNKFMC